MHLHFVTDFVDEQKEESRPPEPPKWKGKKTRKLSQTLRAYNSQMRWAILLKFGMWGAVGGGRLLYENNLSSTREHGATYAFYFFLLIYSQCGTPALLGRTTHYHVS